jgi:nucleotide-binding universal stress UspA family protein
MRMLNTILVPLDGSELAERALTYATALSTRTGAGITLLRAAMSHTLAGVDPRERKQGAIQEAEQYLERVAMPLRARGFRCETRVPYGHAADCIAEEGRLDNSDLIVMASHGRSGPGRWILGSVTASVVASSVVPVLVQRGWHPLFGEPFPNRESKLIVPLDGSTFAETALGIAADLGTDLGGGLVLVRVEGDPLGIPAASEYLGRVQARLAETHAGLTVDIDVRVGERAQGLEQAVALCEAALVVMSTHGRGGARRAILGSVADKFMQQGDVPVVLVRPAPYDDTAVPHTPREVAASAR